jgi:3'-5' exonuclease
MNILVFAIQTIPDIDGARRLYDLHGLSDDDVARAVLHKCRQLSNKESFPLHLQKIAAISAVWSSDERFTVWSLGNEQSGEQDLLQRFYDGIDRYTPHLVTWGGQGFEMPVIHYRSLKFPINAARYWESGENDSQFKQDNYLSRYHQRHTDLMDVLAAYRKDTAAGLNEIAILCGFPGNLSHAENRDDDSLLEYDFTALCQQSEIKVLNTYLLYLNWQRNRGHLTSDEYDARCSLVRAELTKSETPHLIEFEKNWIDY